MTKKFIFSNETYSILGACFNVYKQLGCGFLECVYQEALEIEFAFQKISFESQKELKIKYRGKILKQTYKPDFICYNKIILEIKSVSNIADEHRAQLLNYLHASRFELGLIVNFGHFPKLEHERLIIK